MKFLKRGLPRARKASLSLSINAIVMLVMAITMLGLGLTFIRGMFSSGTSKLGSAIETTDLDNPPDSQNPVTIQNSVTVKANGDSVEVKVGYYNNQNDELVDIRPGIKSCIDENGDTVDSAEISMIAPVQSIDPGNAVAYKSIVKTGSLTGGSTYICTIESQDQSGASDDSFPETAQFFVKTKN